MPGWYGHRVDLKIDKGALRTRIELSSPCEILAQEVNADIENMVAKIEGGAGGLMSEIARMSHDLQVSALNSYGSNKSSTLAGSITEEVNGNSASIGTDLFYAQYVNDGRGSVTGNDVLHFYNDGEEVFVRSVGPAAPRPYLDTSSVMLEIQIDDLISSFLESV